MPYERSGLASDLLEPIASVLDKPPFEDVCQAHRVRVRGLCRKLLRSEADAEDAVQEAMLRAYKAWPQFRAGENPWPWLATIAANVCRDAGRRESRTAAYVATVDLDEQYSPDCYDEAARNARCELVQEALASLPPAYGTPLYLRDIEGWSVPDIARLRGRSVASVRSSLTRSRKVLATRIEALARAKHQWPLPVAAPLVARLRSRVARVKAATDGASISGWMQIDSAFSALTSLRLAAFLQVAAASVAAAALTVAAGGAANSAAASSSPQSPAPGVAAAAPLPTEPVPNPSSDPTADVGAAASPAPAVAISAARINDAGVTETPGAVATPPSAPPVADDENVYFFVGPTRVDCSSAGGQPGAWEESCRTIALAPVPSLRPDADEH